MRRQLHSTAAISATVLVLCAASAAFLAIALLPASPAIGLAPIVNSNVSGPVLHLAKATMAILWIGYAAGVAGWIGVFLLGADGMHRLNSVLNQRRSR